jgi:DNA mismatch endonuclease (patch repair protein)
MDSLTRQQRSWNMSRIRGRDTRAELAVRSALHHLGYRFRLHGQLPGQPDVVLARHRTAIFVHGCFWHRHRGCKFAYKPKTNVAFWAQKFEKNVLRDSRNSKSLNRLGWRVVVVWECQSAVRKTLPKQLTAALAKRAASRKPPRIGR